MTERYLRMNLLTKISSIIILVFTHSFTLAQDDCRSRVSVITNKPESVILLNGKPAGNGSAVFELAKGKYSIVVRQEKLEWNAQVFRDSVFINDCSVSKDLHYNFRDEVYLTTTPTNAGVFHNDSLIGYTPLYVDTPADEVEIRKSNYNAEKVTLNGNKYSVVNLEYSGPKDEASFFKTNLFKILLGSALTLGGTAAYFKLKADDEYEKYKRTNEAAYLNRTDNYDLVSGIAFGALQINFGLLIYYFLTD